MNPRHAKLHPGLLQQGLRNPHNPHGSSRHMAERMEGMIRSRFTQLFALPAEFPRWFTSVSLTGDGDVLLTLSRPFCVLSFRKAGGRGGYEGDRGGRGQYDGRGDVGRGDGGDGDHHGGGGGRGGYGYRDRGGNYRQPGGCVDSSSRSTCLRGHQNLCASSHVSCRAFRNRIELGGRIHCGPFEMAVGLWGVNEIMAK